MVSTPRSAFGWFAPPELPRADLRRHARALWITSWPLFAVVTVTLGLAVLVEPQTASRRATTVAAVGTLVLILHAISRASRPVLASWTLVIGLSVIVTQRAWITGGIHAPVEMFYVLFIVMAGQLIGERGAIVTAAVCFLGAIVLAVGTEFQWLTPRPGAGSPLGAFVFVVLAIGLALVLEALMTAGHREEPAIGGATTLNSVTSNLLDVSRLESGRMPVSRSVTDLSALTDTVVTSFRVLEPARDIALAIRDDAVCNCDPELTRRIIENLVSNALKQTPIEGRVRVVVSVSGDTVRIAVHDEGHGVPADERARIFEPLSAGTVQTASAYESSGLGLAFCKLATEAQGGTIRIENRAPRGSVFVVDLPR